MRTPLPVADLPSLSYGERLAVYTWRRLLAGPQSCMAMGDTVAWTENVDLVRATRFLRVVRRWDCNNPAEDSVQRRIGCPGSLDVTRDEWILLRCAAAAQAEDEPGFEAGLTQLRLPGALLRRVRDALHMLAMALAARGHLLPAAHPAWSLAA